MLTAARVGVFGLPYVIESLQDRYEFQGSLKFDSRKPEHLNDFELAILVDAVPGALTPGEVSCATKNGAGCRQICLSLGVCADSEEMTYAEWRGCEAVVELVVKELAGAGIEVMLRAENMHPEVWAGAASA